MGSLTYFQSIGILWYLMSLNLQLDVLCPTILLLISFFFSQLAMLLYILHYKPDLNNCEFLYNFFCFVAFIWFNPYGIQKKRNIFLFKLFFLLLKSKELKNTSSRYYSKSCKIRKNREYDYSFLPSLSNCQLFIESRWEYGIKEKVLTVGYQNFMLLQLHLHI